MAPPRGDRLSGGLLSSADAGGVGAGGWFYGVGGDAVRADGAGGAVFNGAVAIAFDDLSGRKIVVGRSRRPQGLSGNRRASPQFRGSADPRQFHRHRPPLRSRFITTITRHSLGRGKRPHDHSRLRDARPLPWPQPCRSAGLADGTMEPVASPLRRSSLPKNAHLGIILDEAWGRKIFRPDNYGYKTS